MAKKKKNHKALLILITIFLLLFGFIFFLYKVYDETVNVDTFYEGIRIDEEDVYGLTKEQATSKLMVKYSEKFDNKKLILQAKDYQVELSPKQLGFEPVIDEAVDKAFMTAREGNPIERFQSVMKLKEGLDFPLRYVYDENMVMQVAKDVANALNKEPVDGNFQFKDGRIIASDGESGYSVDEEILRSEIRNYLQQGIFDPNDIKKVQVKLNEIKPEKYANYSRINGIIGEFSTSLKGSTNNRVDNVRVATKALSNLIIEPGEEISFNGKTGLRNAKNGFKVASVIQDGQYQDGMGGGVCQVSTTLYNALIRAGAEVTERHNHSIPASYVELGFDAAVNDGNMDFKFKNNFDYPIFITGAVNGGRVRFYVYGDKDKANKYEFQMIENGRTEPDTQEILDNTLPDNSRQLEKQGRPGISVATYRWIKGSPETKKILAKSNYRKIDFVYKVGPKVAEPIEKIDNTTKPEEQPEETVEETPADEVPFVDPNNPNNNAPDGY